MKYLGYAIVPLSVGLLTPVFYLLIRKNNLRKESKMKANNFIISSSIALCGILLFAELVYSIVLVLLNIFERIDIIQNAVCIPFLLFFAVGCFALIREKIIIKDDDIKHTPPFGKLRTYKFQDIKEIKETVTSRGLVSYKVFSDKKLFTISNLNVGTRLFIERAKKLNIKFETKSK